MVGSRSEFGEVVSAGLRYLGGEVAIEAGFAKWLVEPKKFRPILTVARQF